jgi:hypothetical protein
MRIHRAIAVVAILTFVRATAAADDRTYVDPAGFSFTYPDGWVLIDKPGSLMQSNLPPAIQSWIKQNNVSLEKVSACLIRNGQSKFLENLNVVVDNQQMPMTDATVKKLLDLLPKKYRTAGLTMDKLEINLEQFGKNDAIEVEYQTKFPGVATPLRQRQVFFAGGGKTYIVTCSALSSTYGEYAGTFESILESFKVPSPGLQQQLGFDWNRTLVVAFVGGLIGGLVGLVKKFKVIS